MYSQTWHYIRNGLIENKLVLRNHFVWPICHLLHKDKELLAIRNNFRATLKFLIAKFDCTSKIIVVRWKEESHRIIRTVLKKMRFKYQPKELLIPKVFLRGRREQKQYTISEWQSPVEAVASTSARMRQRRLPAAGFTKRAALNQTHTAKCLEERSHWSERKKVSGKTTS